MKYHLFLDETGDHGLTYIDKNFPLFLLCGCLFSEKSLCEVKDRIDVLKVKYFKTLDVVLHSRDIRKCEGAFQILFDLKLKEAFYKDLNAVLSGCDYTIIGVGINKEEHIKKYGKQAHDPYSLSLSFVIERTIFFLDSVDKWAFVDDIYLYIGYPKVSGHRLPVNFYTALQKGEQYGRTTATRTSGTAIRNRRKAESHLYRFTQKQEVVF